MGEALKTFADFFVNNYLNIIATVVALIVGGILITLLCKLLMKIIYSTRIDNAVGGFFVALIRVFLWILLMFACINILGIDGNSFLVAFSSVALAIGLALKDSLANIANGIIIVATKPFRKGDHVKIGSVEGTVKKISIIHTELQTFDNNVILLPNSSVTGGEIYNYSKNPIRRLDRVFSVSYDADMEKVKEVLMEVANNLPETLKSPEAQVFMKEHSASSVDFTFRIWVNNSDYWKVYNSLPGIVFAAFKDNNIEIPFTQVDIHVRDK